MRGAFYCLCSAGSTLTDRASADMQVLDELRHLEGFFEELSRAGTPVRALYERVQSSGNVLPRLCVL